MDQSPFLITNSHWASQEIPRLLWNTKVHYSVQKSPPLISKGQGQTHQVYTFPSYFPKIHSSIIFLSTTRSSEWSLSFRFSDQNFAFLILQIRTTGATYHIVFYFITLIVFGEACKSQGSSSCSLLQSPATSSRSGLNIHLNTLFSSTLNLRCVRD
jgi:hypothetical protein